MNRKRWIALLLAMVMALGLVGCGGKTPDAAPDPEPDQSTDGAVTVTDMIGREVTVIPGSYQRVVCIGRRGPADLQLRGRCGAAVRRGGH